MGIDFTSLDPEICCVYTYLIYNCPHKTDEFDIRRDCNGVVRKDMFYIGQIHSPNPSKLKLRHKGHMRKDRVKQKVDFFLHTHKFDLFYLWFGYIEDVDATERYFIDTFNSFDELNLETGGAVLKTCASEVRQKLSEKAKKNWNDEEFKKKMNESIARYWSNPKNHILRTGEYNPMTGKSKSDDHKKKISDKLKQNWENESYREEHLKYLKPLWEREVSAENREKLSQSMKKMWNDPIYRSKHEGENHHFYGKPSKTFYQSKIVYQYDAEGNFINKYDSLTDAAKAIGVCKHSIYVALDKDNRKCKGYIWKTLKDETEEIK